MTQQSIKVVLHNEPHPEDNAMLQALYSRSAESVTEHIEKLKQVGSGKFMSQYYLGYGHASIADCGFITVYAENVSMLAAKAIQDNPLYNGQESSSRYIDWSKQGFINPYSAEDKMVWVKSEQVLTALRTFYITQKPVVIEHLKSLYPKKEDEKDTIYEKAITAKAFDILRGFLPCGAATNVAWTTSLRKANEHLAYLSLHPLVELREIAAALHEVLIEAYPNSISPLLKYEEADDYLKNHLHYYSSGFNLWSGEYKVASQEAVDEFDVISSNQGLQLPELYEERPRKAPLPKHDVSLYQGIDYYFRLDFGSYRDLQRHRGGYCSVPAIDNDDGFHPWYYDQLPESSRKEADRIFALISDFVTETVKYGTADEEVGADDQIEDLTDLKLANQYILPMGTLVNLNLHYNVHQSLYVAELRSSQTVHATLRPVAQRIGYWLQNGMGIKTYCDFNGDEWNTRRGNQDIVKK